LIADSTCVAASRKPIATIANSSDPAFIRGGTENDDLFTGAVFLERNHASDRCGGNTGGGGNDEFHAVDSAGVKLDRATFGVGFPYS
jgi:hypothetical protein